jgi:hypothetical protein
MALLASPLHLLSVVLWGVQCEDKGVWACLDRAPNSPANIGKPIFWRTILPPMSYQCAGVESERDDQKIGVVTILWR